MCCVAALPTGRAWLRKSALGGDHNECNGTVRDPKMLAELDELTATTFASGKVERIRLIDFLEEALGRPLTLEESFEEIKKLLD